MNYDLADICRYMKAVVIPDMPENFAVADPFRHGLPAGEIRAGIAAFRGFLYALYDKLAAEKDDIDLETGGNFDPDSAPDLYNVCSPGSVHACYPIINDMAVLLFNLGYHGKLETGPESRLVLHCKDLLTPFDPKNEKYNSLIGMTSERKSELLSILTELGFAFEGLNSDFDFSTIETFYVTHQDGLLPAGLKLMAEAQSAKKISQYHLKGILNLKGVLMRCDFYPLSGKTARMKALNFDLYLSPNPPEVKEWIVHIDKLLTDNGYGASCEISTFNAHIVFTYTSRKLNACHEFDKVCKIYMGLDGCKVFPFGHHFAHDSSVLEELPEHMLDRMSDGKHECTGCGSKRPDLVTHSFRHTHKGVSYRRCKGHGYGFPVNNAEERDILEKWLRTEMAWA